MAGPFWQYDSDNTLLAFRKLHASPKCYITCLCFQKCFLKQIDVLASCRKRLQTVGDIRLILAIQHLNLRLLQGCSITPKPGAGIFGGHHDTQQTFQPMFLLPQHHHDTMVPVGVGGISTLDICVHNISTAQGGGGSFQR